MSGPEPTPDALKVIAGTFRQDRAASDEGAGGELEFERVAELPRAPQWLNADGAAMWRTLGAILVRCGVLQEPDLYAFGHLCHAWQAFVAKAKLGTEVSTAERSTLNQLFSAFGINYAARRRIARNVSQPPPEPPRANRFAGHVRGQPGLGASGRPKT